MGPTAVGGSRGCQLCLALRGEGLQARKERGLPIVRALLAWLHARQAQCAPLTYICIPHFAGMNEPNSECIITPMPKPLVQAIDDLVC